MASEKSDEFIRKFKKYILLQERKQYVVVVAKSRKDNRLLFPTECNDGTRVVQSRNKNELTGVIPIDSSEELYSLEERAEKESFKRYGHKKVMIGVPEVQFLDVGVIDFAKKVRDSDSTFFQWEGLSLNYRAEPYYFDDSRRTMNEMIELSDSVQYQKGVCFLGNCTNDSIFTMRFDNEGNPDKWSSVQNIVGERQYEGRCRDHHFVPEKEEAALILSIMKRHGENGIPSIDSRIEEFARNLGIPFDMTCNILSAYKRDSWIEEKNGILRYHPL